MNLFKSAQVILRVGVAFVFLYAAVDGFIEPYSWIDYFPTFLTMLAPALILIKIWGVFEIIIALWILWGRWVWIPSGIATILLVSIVVFNLVEFQILFRDLAIAAAAWALALDSYKYAHAT